jgi:hypothetical protein
MRIRSSLTAGCLLGAVISLMAADSALPQAPYPWPMLGNYAGRPPVYPNVQKSQCAYCKAVRFGLAPVAPPLITRCQDGRGLYCPPYYAYPRPPLGCQGYAGFSGTDPNAYRAVIPPAIPPTIPYTPTPEKKSPTVSSVEPIPTPPSDLEP